MASFEQRGNSVRATISLPGRKKISQTFDTRAEAELWAHRAERKKADGAVKGGKVAGVTVGELFEEYDDEVAGKTDSGKWNSLRLVRWQRDPLAAKPLGAIVTHDINDWIKRRAKDVDQRTGKPISGATINRELNLMSGAFAYAIQVRQWIPVNPVHGANRPEKGKARKPALLTPQQVMAVCLATGYRADQPPLTLTARVGACFLLAMETGIRSGEMLRIRPRDYWRDKSTVHIAALERGGRKASRSGRASVDPSRNVPLTERAIAVLDQLLASMPADQRPNSEAGQSSPPYIVGLRDDQRDALWRKAVGQAGLEDVHFHDMKHEAATRLCQFLDVIELSLAIGTKDLRLLRDTYYVNDASRSAAKLPKTLAG